MFLNVAQAAAALHCNADTVRRLAAAGTLPGRKVGRKWIFDPDTLRAYVNGSWPSTSEAPAAVRWTRFSVRGKLVRRSCNTTDRELAEQFATVLRARYWRRSPLVRVRFS